MLMHQEEQIPTPGDTAPIGARPRDSDGNLCCAAITGHVVYGHLPILLQRRAHHSNRCLDSVFTGPNTFHVSKSGNQTDRAMTAHAEISHVVKEDDPSATVSIHRFAKESSDHNVGPSRLVNHGRAKFVISLSKTLQPLAHRPGPKVRAPAYDQTGRFPPGMGVDHANPPTVYLHERVGP